MMLKKIKIGKINLEKGAMILLVFIMLAIPVSFFAYKSIKSKVISIFSSSIELGDASLIPTKFQYDFPFYFQWESIKLESDSISLSIEKPRISIHPMLAVRRELLSIKADSIYVKIIPPTESDSSQMDLEHISHPDLWLPFRVSVNVNKIEVDVENIGKWNLDEFTAVKSGRQKRFYIRVANIRGSHLARNLFLNAEYRWNELFSDAQVSLSDKLKDSVFITINAPRQRLEDLSMDVSASIENLPFWLGDKWPDSAPNINKINLLSNLSVNALTSKANFDLFLQTKIDAFWQLPDFNATIEILGSHKGISKSEITLKGELGESIEFKGNVNFDLDGSGELEIRGISLTLGPETLPADIKFHKIIKKGNMVSASFTTEAGSNFNARIADIKNPILTFDADIAPKEPWAVQWTNGMVKLESPTILKGSFSFKETVLRANLKTKVPFAYYAAADELDVSLWLDPEGIRFPKGTLKHNGCENDFDGEVMWNKEYFAFKLRQQKGLAEVYGTFDSKIVKSVFDINGSTMAYGTIGPKVDLSLQGINTLLLPLADSTMLKGYSGIVSGNLKHDFGKQIGNASVAVSTKIKDININASADIKLLGNSLLVEKFEVEQNDKKISGYLSALLPSNAEQNVEILKASLKIPNMDLVSLLATFKDSTLTSGFANGNLEFDIEDGLRGGIVFSHIGLNALKDLDSNAIKFPSIYLNAYGDSVNVSTKIFLGDGGLWNGNVEVIASKPRQKKGDFPVRISYIANNIDNVGKFRFDGYLSRDFKYASGNAYINGDWFLPNGIGEIKNANVSISAKTELGKDALDSLNAAFSAKGNRFEKNILKIPFDFNGYVRNGTLFIDPVSIYGESDEKITAKLKLDLASANLKDLSFNTEQFTLFLLDEHWIKIKNGSGKTRLDNDGITIFAELPTITYRMESAEYGTAQASIRGQAAYRLPLQSELTQTNPSITGNFEISKAFYRNQINLVPDPLHLDKTMKSINKFLSSITREKSRSAAETSALNGRPTTLDIKIRTTGSEAATVTSNLIEFPFAVNLSVQGTTRSMLFSGDINAVSQGKIGYSDLAMFELSSFRLYWQDAPLKQGEIELHASNVYPRCMPANDKNSNEETCTVVLNVTGQLAKVNMQPSSSCNTDTSPALIYYSILLGCISDDYESSNFFDPNKVTNKFVGKLISSTANRRFGGNVIGDIDLNLQLIGQEPDTSYIRVPISLSKWVKNLDAIFGYTSDQSSEKRYDKSYEAGLRYTLPVFDSTDINRNFIDPSLDVSTNLVTRFYDIPEGSLEDQSRLEKSVGLLHRHKFWNPCILGIGRCKGDYVDIKTNKANDKETETK